MSPKPSRLIRIILIRTFISVLYINLVMKIKQIPEDFIVKERIDLRFSKGSYSYFKLIKKDWNTSDAIKMIAERLGEKFDKFSYAGNKERKGVTEEVISVYNLPKERLENLNIRDIKLEFL